MIIVNHKQCLSVQYARLQGRFSLPKAVVDAMTTCSESFAWACCRYAAHACPSAACALVLHISASFLAEISARSPRKLFIFIIWKILFWIKVSNKYFIKFWKRKHCFTCRHGVPSPGVAPVFQGFVTHTYRWQVDHDNVTCLNMYITCSMSCRLELVSDRGELLVTCCDACFCFQI